MCRRRRSERWAAMSTETWKRHGAHVTTTEGTPVCGGDPEPDVVPPRLLN